MSRCVDKISHAACGSRRGLQVFQADDDTLNGYCFSCNTFVADPYGDNPPEFDVKAKKTPEQIQAELAEIATYKTLDIPSRKLRKDVLDYFGVKVGVDEERAEEPVQVYFPYTKDGVITGYKTRSIVQKDIQYCIGSIKDVDFFGWEQAVATGAKRLIITEGEFDAVAMRRILELFTKETFREHIPAVVSLISGASSAAKDIARLSARIRAHFREVVLAFDMDDPGRKAVEDVCKVFPGALGVVLPAKDANDCLVQGKGKAAFNAVTFKSEAVKNTRIVTVDSLVDKARQQVPMGFSWPYEKLTKITRGIRMGETAYIGAGVKQGKSELLNALVAHFITVHGWKVFVVKPEEANHRTLQGIVGKVAKKVFHDPQKEFDYEAFDKALPVVQDKLLLLNLYQELGWEGLKEDIRAAVDQGCVCVMIDPITVLSNGINAADANTLLQKMAQELAAMALDLNFFALMFAHLRAPDSGPPHERGGTVLSTQFAGSRAMMRSAHLLIGLEGNRDPDLPVEERDMRQLVVLENRMSGETGKVPLYYDRNTGQFNEL